MINRFIFIFIVIVLAGCSKGPKLDVLQQEIQTRLDTRYAQSLFTVDTFDRRGHQPFQQDSNDGIIVYYKATLVFTADHLMANWNAPGTASLLSLLGATYSGVQGINPDGNKAGDTLTVYGLLAYSQVEGDWSITAYQTDSDLDSGQPSTVFTTEDELAEKLYFNSTTSRQALLQSLNDALVNLNQHDDVQYSAKIQANLASVLTDTHVHLANKQGKSVILSGAQGGVYARLGAGLSQLIINNSLENHTVVSTQGAIDNLHLLREGVADFALSQSDLAAMSYRGTGPYMGLADANLRAVLALYPEAIQIITRNGPSITTLSDLVGKRINIGVLGSGGRVNAEHLLHIAGVDEFILYELAIPDALNALLRNKLDAMIVTTGFPNRTLDAPSDGIKLIEIDDSLKSRLTLNSGYIELTIPGGTYEWQLSDTQTIGVTALLLTRNDVDEDKAKTLEETILSNHDVLGQFAKQASYINENKENKGIPIPLYGANMTSSED